MIPPAASPALSHAATSNVLLIDLRGTACFSSPAPAESDKSAALPTAAYRALLQRIRSLATASGVSTLALISDSADHPVLCANALDTQPLSTLLLPPLPAPSAPLQHLEQAHAAAQGWTAASQPANATSILILSSGGAEHLGAPALLQCSELLAAHSHASGAADRPACVATHVVPSPLVFGTVGLRPAARFAQTPEMFVASQQLTGFSAASAAASSPALHLCRIIPFSTSHPATTSGCATLIGAAHHAHALRAIKLLVFDFDGVMSDNRVLVMQDGSEGTLCNRSDGLGIGLVKAMGLPMLVLSKETNPVVAARCRKLGLECHQGIDDKLTRLRSLAASRGIALTEIAYVGNDINDLPCMNEVGLPIAVADAYPEVLAIASAVTSRAGGMGAVREVCDAIITASKSSSPTPIFLACVGRESK